MHTYISYRHICLCFTSRNYVCMHACMHVCVCVYVYVYIYIYNGPIKKGCLQRVCAIARSLLKGSTRASGRTGLTRVASGCTKDFVAIVLQGGFAGTYTCTGTTILIGRGLGCIRVP